jgi:methylphosphotriester-DNA--protein-cysteine methyltransferase
MSSIAQSARAGAARRVRRTQAERSETTRRELVAAAIRVIESEASRTLNL